MGTRARIAELERRSKVDNVIQGQLADICASLDRDVQRLHEKIDTALELAELRRSAD